MIQLGRLLSTSGCCTACMDNTDGIGQTILELSQASCAAFVLDQDKVRLPETVTRFSSQTGIDAFRLGISPGADFSLVGTLSGEWHVQTVYDKFGVDIQLIGWVEDGTGVFLRSRDGIRPLNVEGWNYFAPLSSRFSGDQDTWAS
jgi:thiamine monophosphate kinase